MEDFLCRFADQFPDLAADILYRDRHKRRNFREETITDVLMAGLTAFEPLGIRVDFPVDESKTGEDMDWEFVDPQAPDRRSYLRLHIQAKRAIISDSKKDPYWFYRELDHGVPQGALKGSQHKLLVDNAVASQGCVPLYMFYHPRDALAERTGKLPAIAGVNVMFADRIPWQLSPGHWPVADKKVEKWRPHFLALSSLLCPGHDATGVPRAQRKRLTYFVFRGYPIVFDRPFFVSPGELADRLNGLWAENEDPDPRKFRAISDIPESTRRALSAGLGAEHTADIERPRVIFRTLRVR